MIFAFSRGEECARIITGTASPAPGPFANAKPYHRSCRFLVLNLANRYMMVGYSMFMSMSWPGRRAEHQGFVRSIGLFFRVSRRVNSRFASFCRPSWLMPASLKRISMTATNASSESMNSRWNGAILPHASSKITGCWSMTRGGTSCCICNIDHSCWNPCSDRSFCRFNASRSFVVALIGPATCSLSDRPARTPRHAASSFDIVRVILLGPAPPLCDMTLGAG